MPFNNTGGQTFTLASSISSTQDIILLSSFSEPVSGTPYTMAYLNTVIAYATIAPKTTQTEFISFTGITQNANGTATLTGVVRGLSRSYPFTSSVTYKLPHGGQTNLVLSNSPQQINEYPVKRNNEAITAYWTVPDPVGMTDIANKEWVLSVVNGGPVSVNTVIVNATAGETVSAGNLLYFDLSSNNWKKTDATVSATVNTTKKGIAQGAGTTGNPIIGGVLLYGLDANQSGLVIGDLEYASNTPGAISPTTGTTESVIGIAYSTTQLYFDPYFYYTLTAQEKAQIGGTGPQVDVYTANVPIGSSSSRFDITNPAGTTFRYTWDGTGTDPNIDASTFPVNSVIEFQAQNFAAGNKGLFKVTGSGTNFVEVTNAGGVAESDKTIGTGYIVKGALWTKPANMKYAVVESVGAGGGGAGTAPSTGNTSAAGGGGAGGYAKKTIATGSLSTTENLVVGYKGIGGTTSPTAGSDGKHSLFSSVITSNGGAGSPQGTAGGIGGTSTGGDINSAGQGGGGGNLLISGGVAAPSGAGGSSVLGGGGASVVNDTGATGGAYGGGGAGASNVGSAAPGGDGASGVVIVTSYF